MTSTSQDTDRDLNAILAARWVTATDLTAEEFARAEQFYWERRAHDDHLHPASASAASLITRLSPCSPRDVGSFGLRLNLESSVSTWVSSRAPSCLGYDRFLRFGRFGIDTPR